MVRSKFDLELVLDWLEGKLDRDTADRVRALVEEADPGQRQTVDWLRSFLNGARGVVLQDPPRSVTDAVLTQLGEPGRLRWPGLIERIRAALTFDSRLHLLAAGTREVGLLDPTYHLVFSAQETDIALDVHATTSGSVVDLEGQVLTATEAGEWILVQLVDDQGKEAGLAAIDQFSQFSLPGISRARYELVITGPRREIVVGPADL